MLFFLSISIIRKQIIDFELDSIICQDFVSQLQSLIRDPVQIANFQIA